MKIVTDDKPIVPPVIAENVPEELRRLDQWIVWRYERGREGDWTKIPYQSRYPMAKASATDPATWGSFDIALAAYRNPHYGISGIGFVFAEDDGLAGVDFDDCMTEDGVDPAVMAWLRRLCSYTECSPSGKGLKVIVRAVHPGHGHKSGNREMYDRGRYFTITGHRTGTHFDIEERQEAYDALHAETFPPAAPREERRNTGSYLSDMERLQKAGAARNGASFLLLWGGNTSAHKSTSEADMALCSHLAFWWERDPVAIDRMFRQSGLMRAKWDERHGERTYGEITIDNVLKGDGDCYEPQANGHRSGGYREASRDEEPAKDAYQTLSGVTAEKIDWLWYPYIPLGKLTMIDGDPGIGKSYVTLQIAADLSRGRRFPGCLCEPLPPSTTILYVCEDGLGDTIRPRLDAMDADLDRIIGHDQIFTLDGIGLEQMEERIREVRPRLIVFDPLETYLGGDVDIHRSNEVRSRLGYLCGMAQRYQFALIALRHLNKGGTGKAIYRGLGSIAFTAMARSVLLAGQEEASGEYALIHTKCNLGPLGEAIGYDIHDGAFHWTGRSDMTAGQLLATGDGAEMSALSEAEQFIEEILHEGDRAQKDIEREAKTLGISVRTLRRAKDRKKVRSYRQSDPGQFGAGCWFWSLQGDMTC